MIDRDCLRVLVQGRLACFTRPELSSERTTYPCLTPSAAEGVLKSIYWKPEFMYEIEGITVLNEIKPFNMRRNEISEVTNLRVVESKLRQGRPDEVFLNAKNCAMQRTTTYLMNVAYVIHARIYVPDEWVETRDAAQREVSKHKEILIRRLTRGAHFRTPCLGLRECAATVRYLEEGTPSPKSFYEWTSCDLGRIQHHINYRDNPRFDPALPADSPVFFNAVMVDGFISSRI